MQYLLDTCVLSDAARPEQFPRLSEWLGLQATDDLMIGALSVGELRYGIERLPAGRRRERLKSWFDAELMPEFDGRVIDIDARVGEAWGLLRAAGESAGRPLPVIDGLLLATAQVHGLTYVTRDVSAVEGRGVSVLSPY